MKAALRDIAEKQRRSFTFVYASEEADTHNADLDMLSAVCIGRFRYTWIDRIPALCVWEYIPE